ncbi:MULTISPECIES: YdeI/OmpD-associated family protein [Xanthomonas]|uniref:YdeI/OmpD-associated family protein n=1 Tax=Xanthomonas TaxID=338 RepID=UPI001AD9CEBA|nr:MULTISPECIES: YdeI/OmpD-associated family protein [unclassified Xanthomonas]MBO9872741.1 YdeI/OmpD-associated family protein [Xanthomonas sp. D-93]WNH45034.1 YdeI/OmpD-associated family protein [Xanthomonas sp. A6251]
MTGSADPIRFQATLLRPAAPPDASWCFLLLPAAASAALPTRGLASVEGRLAGHPFQATLQPDGRGGHWLQVEEALRAAAAVDAGTTVTLEIAPVAVEPEPAVPDDLARALAAHPPARAAWHTLTAVARRDWIFWIGAGKQAQTRVKRIASTCDMLAAGKRRVCCFDRSGMYSKAFAAPQAQ